MSHKSFTVHWNCDFWALRKTLLELLPCDAELLLLSFSKTFDPTIKDGPRFHAVNLIIARLVWPITEKTAATSSATPKHLEDLRCQLKDFLGEEESLHNSKTRWEDFVGSISNIPSPICTQEQTSAAQFCHQGLWRDKTCRGTMIHRLFHNLQS